MARTKRKNTKKEKDILEESGISLSIPDNNIDNSAEEDLLAFTKEEQEHENYMVEKAKKDKEAELRIMDENLKSFYNIIEKQDVWNITRTEKGSRSLKAAMAMISTKTGMYARIPILCKGKKCPYNESCGLVTYNVYPEKEACPVEIAYIQHSWERYSREFNITPEDYTDINLIQEIIKMEIYMNRCTGLMSKEATPVLSMTIGLTEDGEAIEAPAVSKSVEAYERFSKIRERNYGLLMATRKDKSKNHIETHDKGFMDYIEEAENMDDFYEIEQKPEEV